MDIFGIFDWNRKDFFVSIVECLYVFFGLLVGYGCLILLIGVVLSILTRKVPSLFNESKLLAISIYNIGFNLHEQNVMVV